MQLKGRVTRFSEFAGSGLVITKVGIISFSCVARVDSGPDPMEGDTLYLEISNPDRGELEAIVEAVAWARTQIALEVSLASRKMQSQRKPKDDSLSVTFPRKQGTPFADDDMNEEARYFWYLQTIASGVALQELDSIPITELKEMMTHIAIFEAKYPEKAGLIRKQVEKVVAGL
jgi:hypothetical protein